MIFKYQALDSAGSKKEGSIDALNVDVAINSLQRRGLVISSIKGEDEEKSILQFSFSFEHVSNRDIVILSRQMATLFDAQVSALRVFKLLGGESENKTLRKHLLEVADDLQGGSSISKALVKHPKIFSDFYVNMVRSGEESGKLNETFLYLADHLDRTYEVSSKAKNALIYPAFVIFTFISVMVLMLTVVIPKISAILVDSGQELPIYTKVVLAISNFFVNYGIFFLIAVIIGGFFLWRYSRTEEGQLNLSRLKLALPYVGTLYRKLYLSRLSDNMNTMLASAIPIIKSLEITGTVIDNRVYENIIKDVVESVKRGSTLSDSFSHHKEMPSILVQMVKVGEETGELGNILKTLAKFYSREVMNAVDTLVDLIEPAMIVLLGLGVGFLLASVLLPIYNVAGGIN